MDPREAVIRDRVSSAKRVLVFASSKGGVGKTLIACSTALALSARGLRVGLLDLDVTNPTAHIVLGLDPKSVEVEEEKGVKPVIVKGVEFMSPIIFTRGEPSPLRGSEIHDAILELLAVTRWGQLDALIIDAPPGISDEILDIVKYIPAAQSIVVATPSPLSVDSVRRFIKFLRDEGAKVLGLVENMGRGSLEPLAKELEVRYLGFVPYDPELDEALSRGRLEETEFFSRVREVAQRILSTS